MRARHRHFNPKDYGAALAFDSRFLQGFNNNDTVGSWTDRAANIAYTQSTEANKPVYKTAVQGGQPMVLSSANRRLNGDSSNIGTTSASNSITIITVTNVTGTGVLATFKNSVNREFLLYYASPISYWSFRGVAGRQWNRSNPSSVSIESLVGSTAYINNSTIASNAQTHGGVGNTNAICNAGSQNTAWAGNIGVIIYFNAVLSVSQFRRVQDALAFSFKIGY